MARRRQEAGAVAIVLALLTCFLIVPLGALAVDIGIQRVARRDMQSVADTVSLDMVRSLTGSPASSYVASTLQAAANASRDRSKGWVGSTPKVTVYLGTVDPSKFVSNQANFCNGTADSSGYFTVATGTTVPTAVLVTATNVVNFSLIPGSGATCRSSVAVAQKLVCLTADSYGAALASGNSAVLGPLSKILGSNFNVGVLNSSGIATTNVGILPLLNVLKANLAVGSTDQVLTSNITISQLLAAETTVLNQQGSSAAAVNALGSQFINNIGVMTSPASFQLGTLLGMTTGSGAALGTTINALDLATAAVQLANGSHAIQVDITTPPLVANLSASLYITQGAQEKCTPPTTPLTVSTSQVGATITGNLTSASLVNSLVTGLTNLVSGLLGALSGHTITVSVGSFSVSAQAAQATGTVSAVDCAAGSNIPTDVKVAESSSLAPITISIPLTITDTYHPLIGTGYVHTATLTTTVTTVVTQAGATTATFLPSDYGQAKAGPSGNLSVGNLTVSTSLVTDSNGLINSTLGGLVSTVNSIGNSVTGIESTVLTPLLTNVTSGLQSLLGLSLAGSTFTVSGNLPSSSAVPSRPTCGSPSIAG